MDKSDHNSKIEKIASMITADRISLDEQDQNKLKSLEGHISDQSVLSDTEIIIKSNTYYFDYDIYNH